MQNVLIEKPYEFVPPIRARWPSRWFARLGLFRGLLRKRYGVVEHECRNLDRLRASMAAGHGVMLCSNHPRMADAVSLGFVARETPCEFYAMASWHLFNQGWFSRFMMRLLGAFSVYREGLDRQAIDEAVRILQNAERPLLIFPEGTTSRTNDQLLSFMEGPAFIARTAAKRRSKENGKKVVVHPVALKYLFLGDVERSASKVLSDIERRLTWQNGNELPLVDRLIKVGTALLSLKELEHGLPMSTDMTLRERQTALVNHLLDPLETKWLGGPRRDGIAMRIKNLRMKIFPDMSRGELTEDDRNTRWRELQDTYLAQQVDLYPDRYVVKHPSVDRILETVEKFEEDLTDRFQVNGNLRVVIEVGEAIEVSPDRERSQNGGDPLMNAIRDQIAAMLERLMLESRMYGPTPEK